MCGRARSRGGRIERRGSPAGRPGRHLGDDVVGLGEIRGEAKRARRRERRGATDRGGDDARESRRRKGWRGGRPHTWHRGAPSTETVSPSPKAPRWTYACVPCTRTGRGARRRASWPRRSRIDTRGDHRLREGSTRWAFPRGNAGRRRAATPRGGASAESDARGKPQRPVPVAVPGDARTRAAEKDTATPRRTARLDSSKAHHAMNPASRRL